MTPKEPTPATSAGHRKALDWVATGPKLLLIDGKWVPARSGQTFEAIDPATEEVLVSIALADRADVDAAVVAARRAFEASSWSGISPHARARVLLKIADIIDANGDELSALESLDNGMPFTASKGRIGKVAELFRYYAGWCSKISGRTEPYEASGFLYTLREPMGVCGQINAWNMPLPTVAIKLATALCCGNTVVFKPAEQASLSTLRLGELVQETGLPHGVFNIVPGLGSGAGAAIAAHPGIDKVAFTGSTAVGKQILIASTGNLKRVTLELGGKSPHIIFPDADVDKALQAAVNSFCGNSGQVCSAGTRLFVHESLQDEFAERISRAAAALKVGAPFDADTRLGPLISGKQMERVLSYVDTGKQERARVRLEGSRLGDKGYYVTPTVFSHVANAMTVAREEIFGPVLTIIPFKDEDDAIFQGNDTVYGLAAGIWTRDVSRAHRVARAIKAGRIWINNYGDSDPVMSFGGYKQSGYGREQGVESIDAYTQTKSVLLRL